MTRKWLLTASIMIIGTATLFGCGKTTTSSTASDTQEVTTEATTESTETTTEASTESTSTSSTTEDTAEDTTTDDSNQPAKEETPSTEPSTESSNSNNNSSNNTASTSEDETVTPKVDKTTSGSGIFNGQIDSTSIEVQMDDGSYETFFIYDEDIAKQFDNMDIGAKISFTYGPVKGQVNPEILSVTEEN